MITPMNTHLAHSYAFQDFGAMTSYTTKDLMAEHAPSPFPVSRHLQGALDAAKQASAGEMPGVVITVQQGFYHLQPAYVVSQDSQSGKDGTRLAGQFMSFDPEITPLTDASFSAADHFTELSPSLVAMVDGDVVVQPELSKLR